MKTDQATRDWARKCASYVLGYVGLFMVIVSISMPVMNDEVRHLWFSLPNFLYLLPVPVITAGLFVMVWRDLHTNPGNRPFFLSICIFLMGYLGLGISLWPWMVPFAVTFRQAAATGSTLSFLLVGTSVILPLIITYTSFCYYVFRGKVSTGGYY